jgi:putative transposase
MVMPSRFTERNFVSGYYYHLYNRGAHQQLLYKDADDYHAFLEILRHYLLHPLGTPPSIITRFHEAKYHRAAQEETEDRIYKPEPKAYTLTAYCLMPNHFHLMIRQEVGDITLSNLMRRLCVGYAMYYNQRYHHSGTIFQGKYKNITVLSEMQWLYLTKYIHRNPLHLPGAKTNDLDTYPYSSYHNYIGKQTDTWLSTTEILGRYHHDPYREYAAFVRDGSDVGPIKPFAIDSDTLQS